MKISKVLLRWYKSFNTNYRGYADRQQDVLSRPWNTLALEDGEPSDYPFIEIPIEHDITTIVGANESGKSHLLSAISKVITGRGIAGVGDYSRTDLCHYAALRGKNADLWPHIGIEFEPDTVEEFIRLLEAAGVNRSEVADAEELPYARIVLAPSDNDSIAYLYVGAIEMPFPLDKEKLASVRRCLPNVSYIHSAAAMSDQLPLLNLLREYGCEDYKSSRVFDYRVAQAAAQLVANLPSAMKDGKVPEARRKDIQKLADALKGHELTQQTEGALEVLLFRDVLEIKEETLCYLNSLDETERGYIEGLIGTWNEEIEQQLNLSRYWQQDDMFAIRVNYKLGMLFFEITDKTLSIYTFRERSSGLRYFLSYYIQAKALSQTTGDADTVILMDEPDSFLSSLGQRNLLAVFESLIQPDSSKGRMQLVYATHSPFLINRNFPRRIRLVRKGDAEEGTQYTDQAMVRRYEPIRSALGIDCAQTLFMGNTNIVLEGPADQFLVSELVRCLITPDTVDDFIDLNTTTVVSAESAPGIEKLIRASQWGDELIPTVVIVVDNDGEGRRVRDRITGVARGCKKLVEPDQVTTIAEVLGGGGIEQKFVTLDDLVPGELYGTAVVKYIERWYGDTWKAKGGEIEKTIRKRLAEREGVIAMARAVFSEFVFEEDAGFDKLGVNQEIIRIVERGLVEGGESRNPQIAELERRVRVLCEYLRRRIAMSRRAERRRSGSQAVKRIVGDFLVRRRLGASVFSVILVLERLEREAELLADDGTVLGTAIALLLAKAKQLRTAGQARFAGTIWKRWQRCLDHLRKEPLQPSKPDVDVLDEEEESPEE